MSKRTIGRPAPAAFGIRTPERSEPSGDGPADAVLSGSGAIRGFRDARGEVGQWFGRMDRVVAVALGLAAMATSSALVGLGFTALATPAAAQAMPPQPGPFQACMAEKLTGRSLDDYSVRDAARLCRDVTDEAGRATLREAGLDPATFESCPEKPLTDAEILKLRGASGPYFMMLTTFVWEVENIFPKRVLRSIEVRHYTPTMNEVGFSTRALIGPGGKGTFVLFDLGEMIPQLKHTLKIARMTYCELP